MITANDMDARVREIQETMQMASALITALAADNAQLEADLVSQRFAARSHAETVGQLTAINADLVLALREIKLASNAGIDDGNMLAMMAIVDMCDAALRQAGQT